MLIPPFLQKSRCTVKIFQPSLPSVLQWNHTCRFSLGKKRKGSQLGPGCWKLPLLAEADSKGDDPEGDTRPLSSRYTSSMNLNLVTCPRVLHNKVLGRFAPKITANVLLQLHLPVGLMRVDGQGRDAFLSLPVAPGVSDTIDLGELLWYQIDMNCMKKARTVITVVSGSFRNSMFFLQCRSHKPGRNWLVSNENSSGGKSNVPVLISWN